MITNRCPYCSASHLPQARFCPKCGKVLPASAPLPATATCPRCHVPILPNARFCPACGYSMTTPPPIPPPAPAGIPVNAKSPGTQLVSGLDTPELVIRWPGGNEERHQLTKSTIQVGRAPDNDVVINSPLVSGHHLRLETQTGGMTITDMNSTNGTQINGQRIQPGVPLLLRPGDPIRVGDLTGNSVRMSIETGAGGALRTQAVGQLDLSRLSTQPSVLIGRALTSDLRLDHPTVSQSHAMIFRQNNGVAIRDLGSTNGTFVNGSRISQGLLNTGDEIQIGPYRLVYDAQGQNLAGSMRMGHRLDALQLVKQVKGGKIILNNVTLSIQSSEFVALVGGSGAGKSTLMKSLNGYEPATGGQVLIDGEDLYSKLDMYRTEMGYVPQDDIIHRVLPVRLALWYAAKLRLPDASSSDIQRSIDDALKMVEMTEHADKRVSDLSGGQRKRVSIAVELLAQPTLFFLDEPTSGLDPGLEKKMMYDMNRLADQGRTVVMVTHATANIEQCDFVAFMAGGGRLAYYGPPKEAITFFGAQDFADIYQKLSQDINPAQGKLPPPELQPYYQQSAAASGGSGRVSAGVLWAEHFRHSPLYQKFVASRQSNLQMGGQPMAAQAPPPRKRPRDSFIRQSWILARRQFDLIRHDMRTLVILLLMMPLIGALFALVAKERALVGGYENSQGTFVTKNIEAEIKADLEDEDVDTIKKYTPYPDAKMLLVMIGLALTQGGTFGAAYEIVKERAIFKRERAVNLSVLAYVLSKVLVLALFAVLQVVGVLLMISLKVDMSFEGIIFTDAAWIEVFITLYLAVLASVAFGLFLSAIVPSTDVVLYIILAQLFVQIVLSGTLFPMPSNPASYVTPGYWTMNALASIVDLPKLDKAALSCKVVEIPSMTGGDPTKEVNCASASAEEESLKSYDHTEEHLIGDWAALGGHIFLWVLLTIIVQARQKTGKE